MTLRRLRRLRPKEEDEEEEDAAAPERPGSADVYRVLAAAGGTLPRVRKVGLPAAPPPPPPGAGKGRGSPLGAAAPRSAIVHRWGPSAATRDGLGGAGGAG